MQPLGRHLRRWRLGEVQLHCCLEHLEFGQLVDSAVEQPRGGERRSIVALGVGPHSQKARYLARPGAHSMKTDQFLCIASGESCDVVSTITSAAAIKVNDRLAAIRKQDVRAVEIAMGEAERQRRFVSTVISRSPAVSGGATRIAPGDITSHRGRRLKPTWSRGGVRSTRRAAYAGTGGSTCWRGLWPGKAGVGGGAGVLGSRDATSYPAASPCAVPLSPGRVLL